MQCEHSVIFLRGTGSKSNYSPVKMSFLLPGSYSIGELVLGGAVTVRQVNVSRFQDGLFSVAMWSWSTVGWCVLA